MTNNSVSQRIVCPHKGQLPNRPWPHPRLLPLLPDNRAHSWGRILPTKLVTVSAGRVIALRVDVPLLLRKQAS